MKHQGTRPGHRAQDAHRPLESVKINRNWSPKWQMMAKELQESFKIFQPFRKLPKASKIFQTTFEHGLYVYIGFWGSNFQWRCHWGCKWGDVIGTHFSSWTIDFHHWYMIIRYYQILSVGLVAPCHSVRPLNCCFTSTWSVRFSNISPEVWLYSLWPSVLASGSRGDAWAWCWVWFKYLGCTILPRVGTSWKFRKFGTWAKIFERRTWGCETAPKICLIDLSNTIFSTSSYIFLLDL